MPKLFRFKSNGNSGAGLVQILVLIGIVGGMSVGVVQVAKIINSTQKKISQSLEADQLTSKVTYSLQNKENCINTFNSTIPTTYHKSIETNRVSAIVRSNGTAVVSTNDEIGQLSGGNLTLQDIYVGGLSASLNNAVVNLVFVKKTMSMGGDTIRRQIPIRVVLSGGAGSAITACQADKTSFNEELCNTLGGTLNPVTFKCDSISIDQETSSEFAVESTGSMVVLKKSQLEMNLILDGGTSAGFMSNNTDDQPFLIKDNLIVTGSVTATGNTIEVKAGDVYADNRVNIGKNLLVEGEISDIVDSVINFDQNVTIGKNLTIEEDLDIGGNIKNSDNSTISINDDVIAEKNISVLNNNVEARKVTINTGQAVFSGFISSPDKVNARDLITKGYLQSMFDTLLGGVDSASTKGTVVNALVSGSASKGAANFEKISWLRDEVAKRAKNATFKILKVECLSTSGGCASSTNCKSGYYAADFNFSVTKDSQGVPKLGLFQFTCIEDTTSITMVAGENSTLISGGTVSCAEGYFAKTITLVDASSADGDPIKIKIDCAIDISPELGGKCSSTKLMVGFNDSAPYSIKCE